jgi:hypothetical protein
MLRDWFCTHVQPQHQADRLKAMSTTRETNKTEQKRKRGKQRQAEASRGKQRQAEASRGKQRQAEASRGKGKEEKRIAKRESNQGSDQ